MAKLPEVEAFAKGGRGHIRHWSYFPPFFRALRHYRFPLLRIVTDLRDRPLEVRWAWIFNVPRYAIGLRFVPDADDQDGRLDLATFRDGGVLKGLVYFCGVVTGRHRRWSDWQVERARRIEITSASEVPYQLDGDPGGSLPLTIEVLPGRLTIIAPPEPAT
jgi:diacylglycerol kinase (ATP)